MFGTILNHEYELAQSEFAFTDEHLRELARNSFEASFLPAEKKVAFLNLLDQCRPVTSPPRIHAEQQAVERRPCFLVGRHVDRILVSVLCLSALIRGSAVGSPFARAFSPYAVHNDGLRLSCGLIIRSQHAVFAEPNCAVPSRHFRAVFMAGAKSPGGSSPPTTRFSPT